MLNKLKYLRETKEDIRHALMAIGYKIAPDVPFNNYAAIILEDSDPEKDSAMELYERTLAKVAEGDFLSQTWVEYQEVVEANKVVRDNTVGEIRRATENIAKAQKGLVPADFVVVGDRSFSGGTDGNFRYIGTDKKVFMPNEIKGVPVTSYSKMFTTEQGKQVTHVASNNPNITNMYEMFRGSLAPILDINRINTSNVTDLGYIFRDSQATNILVGDWDTSKVTNMYNVFRDTQSETLEIENWDTSNVTNMRSMFHNCRTKELNIDNWDVSKVTDMYRMFRESSAERLDLDNWNTANVSDMFEIFTLAQAAYIGVKNWSVTKITDMARMFSESRVESLDVSMWDVSNVTNMDSMFYGTPLTKVGVENWDVSKVSHMHNMFGASSLRTVDTSKWVTTSVRDVNYIFFRSSLEEVDISNFDLTNVTSLEGIIRESNVKELRIGQDNVKVDLGLEDTQLDAEALNRVFGELGTPVETREINVSGSLGALECDVSIATAKNWNVITEETTA